MEWIYDRTQSDVDRVRELNAKYIAGTISDDEKAEWAAGLKGALNVSDLNRIEGNMATVAGKVAASIKTKSWSYGDIPRVSDYLRIRGNLQVIKDAWMALSDSPAVPDQPLNTFQKWNDIEKLLHDVNYTYDRTVSSYDYCGSEIYAGEGIGVI